MQYTAVGDPEATAKTTRTAKVRDADKKTVKINGILE